MLERIEKNFTDSIQCKIDHLESDLLQNLNGAALLIVEGLLNEKKILVCGESLAIYLSQMLVHYLVVQYTFERPSFPALSLSNHLLFNYEHIDIYEKQIHVLANEGDILIVFSVLDHSEILHNAILSAIDKGMRIILFVQNNSILINLLNSKTDIVVKVDEKKTLPSLYEMYLLCIHSLCDVIDEYLFNIEE